ncbi:MAG: hypothetical protein JNM17_18460 [Archangium sp.]|nr:hypothetical protein [Archangium sp.]
MPWTGALPAPAFHYFTQSIEGKPELCFDAKEDTAYRVRCDRGTRDLTLAPTFEITNEGRALIMPNKHVHLGDGRFASGIIGSTTNSAYFFLLGREPAVRLDQNDRQVVDVDWRFNTTDHSLWYMLNQDISNRCAYAAFVMRDRDGAERRVCDDLGGMVHQELPLLVSFRPLPGREEISFRRIDVESGTFTTLGVLETNAEWRAPVLDQHRPVVYFDSGLSTWAEVELHDDGTVTTIDSPLSGLLYTIQGVEDSSLEGGDTLIFGVDGSPGSAKLAAVLLKNGKPVARWIGPDQRLNGEFVQAGHQLYLFTSTADPETGKRTLFLTQPEREAL